MSFVRVLLMVIFMPSELGLTMYSLLFLTDVIDIAETEIGMRERRFYYKRIRYRMSYAAICLPFDKFSVGVFADIVFSLLAVWPTGTVTVLVFASVPIVCGGADNVGVFGGDSSFACRADFNLSITALNEPFRFLFA